MRMSFLLGSFNLPLTQVQLMAKRYEVFHRTWWKRSNEWPKGLEPAVGRRNHVTYAFTAEEARQIAEHWNKLRLPGPLFDRAEWWEVI